MRLATRAVFWIVVYLAVAVAPLIFALIDLEPGRGIITNFSVALGFVGLSMMGLQFALVARFQRVAAPFGIDVLLQFHRQIAYVGLAFVLAHPLLLFIANTKFLALLNPMTAPLRAHMAVLSIIALLALVALSVWRKRLHISYISYEAWQLTHGVLAVVAVVAALAHILLVDYYADEPWEKALWVLMSAAFVWLLVWVRIIKPLQRYRHSWIVEKVIPERGNTYTMVLEHADGFNGFTFEPGQFAWIMVGQSPFAITQHPFSFSSSAERTDRVELSVKAAGDFTSEINALVPGTTVYLDGPYGAFTVDRHEGPGFVLIGAGVGVTPLMSILRTLADRKDVRPCYLFLNNRDRESIIFREEIDGLRSRLNLTVVHVLSHPDEAWEGERGHLNADLFRRHLPERYHQLQYFVCGPGPMMDATEDALAEIGVPADHVHTERFAMV
jgi:predicted ferric reductase